MDIYLKHLKNKFQDLIKDKDKHYITSKNIPFINKEYLKVWDSIINRYFQISLRSFSNNNKKLNYEDNL